MYMQIILLDATVADRWFYFPIVGLLGIVGVGIQTTKLSSKNVKMLSWILGIILLSLLSIRTIVRNTNWSDAITLYEHDSNISDNYEIENNLGSEYADIHKYDEALTHYKKSEALFPFETNTYNIGFVYEEMGNLVK